MCNILQDKLDDNLLTYFEVHKQAQVKSSEYVIVYHTVFCGIIYMCLKTPLITCYTKPNLFLCFKSLLKSVKVGDMSLNPSVRYKEGIMMCRDLEKKSKACFQTKNVNVLLRLKYDLTLAKSLSLKPYLLVA